ncbi:MAG: DUF4390 domain-containing protein [Gammaproteobacteria bacterium]
MMVSSTPCCARPETALRRLGWLLLWLWLGLAASAIAADRNAVRQAAIRATTQGYSLDAEIDLALNPTLEDALSRGIPLHFRVELELSRPRSWWFAEDIAEPERKMRIYYHLLLRRYVVESGYRTQTVATLAEALALLGRVEDWQVLERGALKAGQVYTGRLRLRLDTAQLPRPLSFGPVTGDKWDLATPWHEWWFEAPVAPRAAPVVP